MAHVFLSYVRENLALVEKIREALFAHGVVVWLDKYDISPGHRWQDAIRQAIQDGSFFVACFSSEYVDRERTVMNEEIVLAIDELRKRPTDRAWFIPVLLSQCEVPARNVGGGETLRSLQYISLYSSWDEGMRRLLAVIAPGSARIQDLVTRLRDKSARVRVKAADELGLIGTAAESAVPALIDALRDDHVTVRGVAADALGKVGLASEAVVTALLRVEDDGSAYGHQHATESIRLFGVRAVPILVKYLDSDRGMASCALWKIGKDAVQAVPHLIERLGDGNIAFVARALAEIGDVRALPALIREYKRVSGGQGWSFEEMELFGAIARLGEPDTTTRTQGDAEAAAKRVVAGWVADDQG